LFLLAGFTRFKADLKSACDAGETLLVGNLEMTLLENNFYINSF